MMNKEALRELLLTLPPAEALVLAEKETAFWDVWHMHKLTSFREALLFLLGEWLPIEAVALLKQMEPLASGLLFDRLKACAAEPESFTQLLARLGLPEEARAEKAEKLSEILRLCVELKVLTLGSG